jgi:pSer/pThr/pTyr-binding forkhead associated (FHA) protein
MFQAKLSLIQDKYLSDYLIEHEGEDRKIPSVIPIDCDILEIGSDPKTKYSKVIRQNSALISRTHCIITHKKKIGQDEWFVQDQSTNGTYVNGDPLDYGEVRLENLDQVIFGDIKHSVLRYTFSITEKKKEKVPLDDSQFFRVSYKKQKKNKKKIKNIPSQDIAPLATNSRKTCLEMEKILDLLDSKLVKNREFHCKLCKIFKLFHIILLCGDSFCFDCYRNHIAFQKNCVICEASINQLCFPLKSLLINRSIEKRIKKENHWRAISLFEEMQEKFDNDYMVEHLKCRDRIGAYMFFEQLKELPIYSALWTDSMEQEFIKNFELLSDDSKKKVLFQRGLSSEFIDEANDESIDVVFKRLNIKSQHQSQSDKKKVLKKMIN